MADRQRQFRLTRIAALLTFIAGSLIPTPTPAANADPTEVLIFYGGMAPLNGLAQPHLRALMDDAVEGRALPVNPMAAVWKRVNDARFKFSAYPVITSRDRRQTAIAKVLGVMPSDVDGTAIRAKLNDANNLALSLVASFEYSVAIPVDLGDGSAKHWVSHHIVGVTALLSRLGTGRIVASASAVTERRGKEVRNPVGDPRSTRRLVAEAYAEAGMVAVERIVAKAKAFDDDFPSMGMVSFPVVADRKWQAAHKVRSVSLGKHGSVCEIPALCARGDGQCIRAISFIAELATAALSERGYHMMPPGLWAHWGASARGSMDGVVSLKIDTAGGRGMLDRALKLVFEPQAADRKVVVLVKGFTARDDPLPGSKMGSIRREYLPTLDIFAFPTCGTTGAERLHAANYSFRGYRENLDQEIAAKPILGPFWEAVSLISLYHAFEGFGRE